MTHPFRALAAALLVSSLIAIGPPKVTDAQAPGAMRLLSQTYTVQPDNVAGFEFALDLPDLDPPTIATTVSPSTSAPGVGATQPTEPPAQPPVEIVIDVFAAMTGRADVEARLDATTGNTSVADGLGSPTDTYRTPLAPTLTLAEDGGDVAVFDVPIGGDADEPDRLNLPTPDIFPLTISIQRGGDTLATAHTFLERVDGIEVGLGPVTFAILAAIDEPGPAPDADTTARITEQLDRLVAVADTIAAPITAVIPPTVIDTVLAGDPARRQRLATALTGDSILAEPLMSFDVDAAAAADLDDQFGALRDRGAELLQTTFPDSTIVDDTYLIDQQLTVDGAELLDRIGVRFAVVDRPISSTLDAIGVDLTDVDTSLLVSGGDPAGHELAVALVDDAMTLVDPGRTDARTAAADALDLIALTSAQRQGSAPALRSFVVTTPDIGVPDPQVLEHLERYISQHPEFELAELSALRDRSNTNFVDGQPVTIQWPALVDGRLLSRDVELAAVRADISAASSMLVEGDERIEDWQQRLDVAYSTALSNDQALELVDPLRTEADAVRTAIPPPEPFSFTLTGSNSELQLRLINNDDEPLDVVVTLASDRLTADATPVRLQPGVVTNAVIELDVRSNGQTPVDLGVLAPDGTPLFEPVVLTAQVNNLSGLGRVVTVGALLVLLSWWLAHLRKRHRGPTVAT